MAHPPHAHGPHVRSAADGLERRLGPWRLVRLAGQGRWSCVYQARPEAAPADAPADYAVKTPRPDAQAGDLAANLLRREALVASRVAHPHLVSVLDAQLVRPPYYLVSPFLRGGSLAQLLRSGYSPPPPTAFWIVRQTAEALAALHEAGWRHGDVQPANIMMAPDGHVTLIDLGFAQRMHSDETGPRGLRGGAPAYAAPETFQASAPVDAAADVYSLGVTLFQLLAGQRPFPMRDPVELRAAHLHLTPPDVRRLAPHAPRSAARLLKQLLAKEPLRRPTAEELAEQLAGLEIRTFADRQPAAAPA